MRKWFLVLIGVAAISAANAQVLRQDEAALVYYSPKTIINLEFSYTVESYERGQFAEYAESLLGVSDAVKETVCQYTIQDVRIGAASTTDYSRPHKAVYESGVPMLLSINDKGILIGYNTGEKAITHAAKNTQKAPKGSTMSYRNSKGATPYPEEVLKAAKPLAQANEVAKQIFHLRETRMYLLNGEVEHAPADGEAMKLVLEELDRQERALTELFIGKKNVRKEQKKISLEPNDAGNLLFFSAENGFTDSDNIDADTIAVHMTCQQQTVMPTENTGKKKKGTEFSQIVYNIPGYCTIDVFYKGRSLANRTIPVAQLGTDVALPKSLFTGKELPKITFSEKTGNIISIW